MASEPVEELPDDLEAWVAERAAADDTSRADVVRRLIAAHRLLDEQPGRLDGADAAGADGEPPVGAEEAPRSAAVEDLHARVNDLGDRVGGVETDLDEKVADVRDRVIQIKRETDAKAPADHDHPELAERMDEEFGRIDRRLDEGFENYEEVLEYLTERADDLADDADDRAAKLRDVANAVVDLRRRITAIEGVVEERAAVTELRESANRQGIAEAACGSCGESVRLGLLDEPACPHCESPFDGVEPGGWFRSARLTVGDVPALEAARGDGARRSRTDGTDADRGGGADLGHDDTADLGHDDTADLGHDDTADLGRDDTADLSHGDATDVGRDDATDVNRDRDADGVTWVVDDADGSTDGDGADRSADGHDAATGTPWNDAPAGAPATDEAGSGDDEGERDDGGVLNDSEPAADRSDGGADPR